MERRDLIKDEIERLGKVLGKIVADLLNLKASGETNEGIAVTEQALKEELDLDVAHLVQLDEKDFIEEIATNRNFHVQALEQLADVFLELGEGMLKVGDSDNAFLYMQKSLAIYQYINQKTATYSMEREDKELRCRKLLSS